MSNEWERNSEQRFLLRRDTWQRKVESSRQIVEVFVVSKWAFSQRHDSHRTAKRKQRRSGKREVGRGV